MPEFRYEGFSSLGKHETGVISAADENGAYQTLLTLGITATRLSGDGDRGNDTPWYRQDITLTGGHLSLTKQAGMASQLAVLFKSGLPAAEIVAILSRSAPDRASRMLYDRMAALVADGSGFADAFSRANGKASPLFHSVLHIADLAGNRGEVMGILAAFLRRQDQARRRFLGALIYPAILLLAVIGVLLTVALFLTPNLLPMFQALDRPAPALLRFLNGLGAVVTDSPMAAITLVGAMLASGVALALHPALRGQLDRIALRLPVLGPALRDAELSRLSYCLAMLTGAGATLVSAFRETARTLRPYPFGHVLTDCAEALEQGQPASDILAAAPLIPHSFLELFRVGESTNRLPDILNLLASDLENRADQGLSRLLTLLTPILTLVVGGGIALLVYSVMSAILSVNDLAL